MNEIKKKVKASDGRFYFQATLLTSNMDDNGMIFSPEAMLATCEKVRDFEIKVEPEQIMRHGLATRYRSNVMRVCGHIVASWMDPDDLSVCVRGYTNMDVLPQASTMYLCVSGSYTKFTAIGTFFIEERKVNAIMLDGFNLTDLFLVSDPADATLTPLEFDCAKHPWLN